MSRWRYPSVLFVALLIAAACQQSPGGAAPTGGTTPGGGAASPASPTATAGGAASPAVSPGNPNDLLAKVMQAGVLRVSTDPKYPPQSFLKPDGTFEGFDIDVANEIAKRLGVRTKFETPIFDQVVAGGWAGRWEVSVGSVTITEERQKVLDFTEPYYYTPAQMAARKNSGITTIEGFSGKTVCVGVGTTYQQWLQGKLKLVGGPPPSSPPANVKVTTRDTDTDCVADPRSGEGWLTSSTTAATALKSRQGQQYQLVGDPVFFEALAVATDKKGPPHAELQAQLDRIVRELHQDGTLSTLSKKWFDGLDLTQTAP